MRFFAAITFVLVLMPQQVRCQSSVLDSVFTFRAGTVRAGNALELISRRTGYKFTYDSRLINSEEKVTLDFRNEKLGTVLRKILPDSMLVFSVIDRYIIISKPVRQLRQETDSLPSKPITVSGVVTDEESGDPMPFATISVKNSGRGTVSNINGEFVLNLMPSMYSDTLSVSYLGYYGREIPVEC